MAESKPIGRDTMVVLLVDASSVGWRALHAMSSADLTSRGFPTGMILGFLRLVRDALDKTGANFCQVAWDGGSAAFRRELFPEYRIRHDVPDPELEKRRAAFRMQREWLNKHLPLFGIGSWYCKDWEADDLLGYWTLGKEKGIDKYIVMSGDRDMRQLISKSISVLPPDGALITADTFHAIVGISNPTKYFWYRVLTGDASDKIPGVGKIGEKRGKVLIEKGWPKSAKDELTAQQVANAQRNFHLMHIPSAGKLLQEAMQSKQTKLEGFKQVRNLLAAKNALESIGMGSLTDRWGEYAAPFRNLEK